ncbi:MAG: YbjN domain-containing protein, partial [Chthoniobacterales bacterium]
MTHKSLSQTARSRKIGPSSPMSDSEFSSEFGSPYQVLVDHCESAGLQFRQDPEAKAIFFSIRGSLAIYDVALFISHGDEVLQIYVTIPVATNEERFRPLVAEFVTRANHRIVIGHFDYDMDEGKLRYHIGHPFGERGLDEDDVGRPFATAMGTVDRYFPALMRTLVGGETPSDAVYLAELDYHAETEEEGDETTEQNPQALQAPKPPVKKRARRPRKDPRSKS